MAQLDPGAIVEMDISELRALRLPALIRLMHELGLSVDGIEEKGQALTKLVSTAVTA